MENKTRGILNKTKVGQSGVWKCDQCNHNSAERIKVCMSCGKGKRPAPREEGETHTVKTLKKPEEGKFHINEEKIPWKGNANDK